jgi:Pyruvate/2-oxoacid:ferredoxin oxidoreductase gamma subunit
MSMVTATRNEMAYCAGCSHAAVLEQLGAGLERAGLKPDQVCMVSDIGCIGIADKYFACHTFHGLHGRSLTYAEGIKRKRPELTVIVLIGDGGCGIGTAHLVHSARRGIGIKVFVCNNFNFGMTGGQHSPTTPEMGRTPTTPGGSTDQPLDIGQLVVASGAGFVARCGALDRNFGEYIDKMLAAPGFALLDIWELCVAYYMPQNKLTPPALVEMSKNLGMPFGVLADNRHEGNDRRHAGAPDQNPDRKEGAGDRIARGTGNKEQGTEQSRSAPREAPQMDPAWFADWPERAELCVAGSAGERIRSAVGVIGEVCVAGGLFAAQLDDYPITVRKGHSISNLIVSRRPIRYTGLRAPDLLVVQSDDGLRRLGSLDALAAESVVIASADLAMPAAKAPVWKLALKPIAAQVQRENVALSLLSAAIVKRGWMTADAIRAAASAAISGKFRDVSLKAIEVGLTLSA